MKHEIHRTIQEHQVDLLKASIRVIEENQDSSGAYIACPDFPVYRFSWLRDGSFIAYGMMCAGRPESARRFLSWTAKTILSHENQVRKLELLLRKGATPDSSDFLPARYLADGRISDDGWPAFQYDGYGAWLWCLGEYAARFGDTVLIEDCRQAAELTVEYIRLVQGFPCFDCWEENGNRIHPASMACLYGGLQAVSSLYDLPDAELTAGQIKTSFELQTSQSASIPKYFGSSIPDASLIWLAVPFGLLDPDEPRMLNTVAEIESRLLRDNGVCRYEEDSYYGGGRWPLLSAWLGWFYLETGRHEDAKRILAWIEKQADDAGNLPEQISDVLLAPEKLDEWRRRWGEAASPLLWSHAMYLVLRTKLQEKSPSEIYISNKEGAH